MNEPVKVVERIQWHEGMLLAPQHFQQTSSRIDGLIAAHILLAFPFAWGVRRMRMDSGLLAAGTVRILELEAIFPDGTLAIFRADIGVQGSLDLSLAPCAAVLQDGVVDIFLVLPIGTGAHGYSTHERYKSVVSDLVEDEVSSAVAVDIPRLLLNLSLMAGEKPPSSFTSLRIGSVYKDNEVIKWTSTLPPLLEIPADSELWMRVIDFAGQLRSKAAFVAKQTAVPSSKTEDRLAYLEHKDRLRNLLTVLPALEAVVRTPHLHPYSLYLALCALLGPLSMLRPGSLPIVPPVYDHANPSATLGPVLDGLTDSLLEVNQEYREFKFEFRYGAFEIALKTEWLDKQLVIGLRGQPERDLVAWMGGAIIGSQSAYASLRERRILGAARTHIEVAEELGVRSSSGYTLFAIQTSATLTLPEESLIVSNSTESAAAQRPQEMVLFVKG